MLDQNKVLYIRFSLLCALLAVLAFILMMTLQFSWLIVLICAAISIAGIALALKSMVGERPSPMPIIGLVVCVLALLALIVYVIFSINAPESSARLIDQLKDTSTVLQ